MVRITSVPASKARRKKVLKRAKGFYGRNKNTNRITSNVVKRAMANEFVGRKLKKRDMRRLWITRIGIACKNNGISYSKFMDGLKKAAVNINRKVLSDLAIFEEKVFTELVRISKNAVQS